MQDSSISKLNDQISVKQLVLTAQSMEADRRGADQRDLDSQRKLNKKSKSKIRHSAKGKNSSRSNKSPRASSRKSNGKAEP